MLTDEFFDGMVAGGGLRLGGLGFPGVGGVRGGGCEQGRQEYKN